jgi:hypothetical protein
MGDDLKARWRDFRGAGDFGLRIVFLFETKEFTVVIYEE